MSAAIIRLLSDDSLRERVAQAGAETAATYTWDHAADALEQVLVRAVGQEDEREATQM
jgi:glycosyltransferase involved in cell wall biosynthesis